MGLASDTKITTYRLGKHCANLGTIYLQSLL
jgi:hypothetical protein